jgi:hypothetical protein
VDIETTALRPEKGELLTFGFFSSGRVKIIQRTDATEKGDADFRKYIYGWAKFLPTPFYAYNARFEKEWLGIRFYDLMEKWRALSKRLRVKYPKLHELVSVPHGYFGVKSEVGRSIPAIWEEYKGTGETSILAEIVVKNFYDLLREATLLLYDSAVGRLYGSMLMKSGGNQDKIPFWTGEAVLKI